ncbi:STAS domain-containing protein [Pseudonocardia kujensis]|uniref:STAS domain-containing protein n=1 Tax=Pseudonocardia kujensis TaxID=1128675 RepID=UPI001E2DF3DC|nr:STAS domain-containing protein [Pseudonocardia kujensis]MCE0764513.1 STAS domain-containing protein [Pseudonocardia kujensis]
MQVRRTSGTAEINPLLRAGPDDALTVDIERLDRATVVAVAGEIDLVTAAGLDETLQAELQAQPAVLVLDLTGVDFFTSVGLTAVALAHRGAEERGVALRVVADSRRVLRPLQITGMDRTLALYTSRAAALGDA